MSVTSAKSVQMTFEALLPATSSPESAGGTKPYGLPAGRSTDPSGPAAARASRTARRGKASGTPTPATSGPRSSGSSASVALTQCLASKLKGRLNTGGSIEFKQTWREKVTPSGIVYSAHTARARKRSDGFVMTTEPGTSISCESESPSALPTFDSGCTGWPTPAANEYEPANVETMLERRERCKATTSAGNGFGLSLGMAAATFAPWPTPTVPNGGRTGLRTEPGREGTPRHLSDAVTLVMTPPVGWNTPRATDGEKGGPNQSGGALPADAAMVLAGWATPTAQDHSRGTLPPRPQDTGVPLSQMAGLADPPASPWATPAARDYRHPNAKPYTERGGEKKGEQLNNQVVHSGPITNSSPAETGKRGVLNPAFSLWLMGYRAVWLWCAPANNPQPRTKKAKAVKAKASAGSTASVPSEVPETPSSRKSRRSSSPRSSKPKAR